MKTRKHKAIGTTVTKKHKSDKRNREKLKKKTSIFPV